MRPARRPAGWQAPGPPPAGPGTRADLWPGPGEDLCYLTGDWRIFQRTRGHRWSLDDLVTAWYALEAVRGRPVRRHVDLGCGIGSVLMMIAWALPEVRSTGIEAQDVSVGLARRSLAYNGVTDRAGVRHGDLRQVAPGLDAASCDLVTGTPPYFPPGHGTVSDHIQCGPCRHEARGGIEDYCAAAAHLLAPGGRFVTCHAARQSPRVDAAAAGAGLVVLRRRDVFGRAGRPALLAVHVLARADEADDDGGSYEIEPPLVVRDRSGARTAGFVEIRQAMGLPP